MAADWDKIREAARHIHGGVGGLLELADKLNAGREQYEQKHWKAASTRMRRAKQDALPNVTEGLVEMGGLYAITYLTRKGRDKRAEPYEHLFKRPLPLLCFAPDGSGLVIVRDESEYTVTNRGIEG